MYRQILKYACLLYWLILLTAGLWPLNFRPHNDAHPLPGKRAIEFNGRGIVIGPFPEHPAITIEILCRTFEALPGGLPRALSVCSPDGAEDFFLSQWKSELVVRTRLGASGRYREFGLDGALIKDRDQLLTITSGAGGTRLYLDGRPGKAYPSVPLRTAPAAGPKVLILGNDPTGNAGWKGTISGLAFYNRALTPKEVEENARAWQLQGEPALKPAVGLEALYTFDEAGDRAVHNRAAAGNDLSIPAVFKPMKRIVLAIPSRLLTWDLAENILGFIPFGLLQAALLMSSGRRRRLHAVVLTLVLGAALSLMIELIQVYMPGRHSDLSDWLANILGTVLGLSILPLAKAFKNWTQISTDKH